MRWYAAKQMHHYKTATPATPPNMSHSVLRSASQRTNTNNTALHEVMGTLEVYWEQLKSAALAKRWRSVRGTPDQISQSDPDEDTCMNDEWQKAKLKHANRADRKSKFIEANVVFG